MVVVLASLVVRNAAETPLIVQRERQHGGSIKKIETFRKGGRIHGVASDTRRPGHW